MRTLHIGLRVSERERSIAFYRALGYEVLGEVGPAEQVTLTMLKLPDEEFVSLELVHDPDRSRVDPSGLSHLVINVASVEQTVADLASRGVEAEAPTSPDGSAQLWTAWVSDPDGFRIELVQWPPGHPVGMTRADLQAPEGREAVVSTRSAKEVIGELFRRQSAGDQSVLDDLIAADLVNHAAGPQGREGLQAILGTIDFDLGPVTLELHHVVAGGDIVAQHLTLHGTHKASTMPLLAGIPVASRRVTWTFIHLWRVLDGMVVEHWACRDDLGLVEQLQ